MSIRFATEWLPRKAEPFQVRAVERQHDQRLLRGLRASTAPVFQIRSRGMALLCLILTGVPYNR